ncbi:DUF1415 domain-containing protein [Noviherbaspirillum aerium]|uniref:DUF1415 domain-containing protein n=1 Tax=Noviherbaspirillum aerium TaxID=2588497 RepID=UPI00124CFDAF|nr:DUF1415 domain-containing protein [Noviherbaspirillum aerium]
MAILSPAAHSSVASHPPLAQIVHETQSWLVRAVIGLNLCPFAKAVHVKGQIRYAVSDAMDHDTLLKDLVDELLHVHHSPPEELDTTLLIHPWILSDFLDYNDFLGVADAALEELGLTGEIQIASFHPDYQFADAKSTAIENYTNRSPYPILHLLRETSIERAVAAVPEASEIYERNMETMQKLGLDGWRKLFDKHSESNT